jgi:prepilin-type N-terminal cleavage/methylation domain-containing protein
MATRVVRQLERIGRHGLRGFTLAEILIALALIAILAAVLLPTVAGQILKGDAGRVMQDLEAVRAGSDQFLADVHRYPGKYSDLSTKITNTKTDINGNTYPNGLVSKWSGPYVTKDTVTAVVPTGFGGNIQNVFMKVANTNGISYLTIVVLGIAQPDFDRIDLQIDGTVDATKGLLRWNTAGGVDSTKFLATPIQ